MVSGINHGPNLGDDVLYSGTVAAATEGRFLGLPAIAVSLDGETHFDTAAQVTCDVLAMLQRVPLRAGNILNINVPDIPLAEIKGFRITRCGSRHASQHVYTQTDPKGNTLYWIGPPGEKMMWGRIQILQRLMQVMFPSHHYMLIQQRIKRLSY